MSQRGGCLYKNALVPRANKPMFAHGTELNKAPKGVSRDEF